MFCLTPDYTQEMDIPPLKEYDGKDFDQYLSEAKAYAQIGNWDCRTYKIHLLQKNVSLLAANCHQFSGELLASKSKGQRRRGIP